MFWNFILDDGTNQLTLTTQPVGWDSGTGHISRDPEKHGVAFDYAVGNIRYYREGRDFLKAAYESLGTEAKVNIIIQYRCAENSDWQEFYTGKLDFGTYKEFTGVDCYVMINIEATDVVMTFNNRFDQKVNLESLTAFDGAPLQKYPMLGFDVNLKAKAIPVSDKAIIKPGADMVASFVGGLQQPYNSNAPIGVPTNLTYNQLSLGFNEIVASEIGNFYIGGITVDQVINNGVGETFSHTVPGSLVPTIGIWPLGSSPVVNYTEDSPSFGQLNGTCSLKIHARGKLENPNTYVMWPIAFLVGILPRSTRSDFGTKDEDYRWIYQDMMSDSVDPNSFYPPNSPIFLNIDCDVNFELNEGDRLYCFITFVNRTSQAQINAINADTSTFAYNVLYFEDTSYFELYNLSKGGDTAVTPCKSFLVNESLSRAAEAITNAQMRAYSDYFGRTDALPYPSAIDGCGGLEMITNGLFIRGIDRVKTETPPILSISLKDMFEGLNPVHNIGFGFEDDPNRVGFKMLRVEPMEYFYPNDVIFTATNIAKLQIACTPAKIYSKYKFGYEKWESQQFTGLDEFLTSREYRTTLTSVNNTLSKISTFVASGYTIEIVRRIGNTTSKDNSYDNETFIICLQKTIPQSFQVTHTRAPGGGNPYYIFDSIDFANYVNSYDGNQVLFVFNNIVYYLIPYSINLTTGEVIAYDTSFNSVGIDQTDTFYSYSGTYEPEQGNVINPENIIDPDTIYNFRISPIRNAMRWVKSIFQSYKNLPEELVYTDSDGNQYAKGQLPNGDACKLENSDVQENQTITPAMFADANEAKPIFSPEIVTFEYPVSLEDFINIKSNRMGLIQYEFNGVTKQGWISDLQYKFETGMATFQLIPKFE